MRSMPARPAQPPTRGARREHRRFPRAATLVVAVLVTAATLAACTGGAPTQETGDDTGEASISYLIGTPEDPADLKVIQRDIDTFEKDNPGVTVELKTINNDTLRTVLQTQLRSGEGPDVFGYDTGPGFAGVLAEAGLLYDLTDAYERYGWGIYDWARQRVTFDGRLVGVPSQVEEIGVYFNKDLFDKHGLAPPENIADLTRIADTLKGAGVTPFTFSDKEGWEGGHILSIALSSAVGAEGMQALFSGEKSWDSKEVVDAIDLFFGDFNEAGYLPKSPNALTYDNANALFYSGKAAMNPTGTWLSRDIEDSTEFEVGFFPFPAPDGPGIFSGGLGGGTFVSAKTRHPDAALAFLDYLHSRDHGRWQVETFNTIPAYPVDTSGIKAGPLFAQILDDTASISSGTGDFGYNIDVLAGDEFNQAMWNGLQSVLTGQKTAEEVAGDLEATFTPSTAGQ
jgi:raffinose/stachyose/melibiose transport system substrate-binding protein